MSSGHNKLLYARIAEQKLVEKKDEAERIIKNKSSASFPLRQIAIVTVRK